MQKFAKIANCQKRPHFSTDKVPILSLLNFSSIVAKKVFFSSHECTNSIFLSKIYVVTSACFHQGTIARRINKKKQKRLTKLYRFIKRGLSNLLIRKNSNKIRCGDVINNVNLRSKCIAVKMGPFDSTNKTKLLYRIKNKS